MPPVHASWQLALLLKRIANDRAGFERVAFEYALFANVPAPEWEPLVMPKPEPPARDERRGAPRYVAREQIALQGVIDASSNSQLQSVAVFAHDNQYVNIEMSNLERLSTDAAATLAHYVEAAAQAGKTVRLIRPNPFVLVLLELLNLRRSAAIVPQSA